jgi:hypothetical protein
LDCGLNNSLQAIQPNRSTMRINFNEKPTFRPSVAWDSRLLEITTVTLGIEA